MSERDTHFAGFAELLMREIDEQVGAVTQWGIERDSDEAEIGRELYSRWRTLIARRAYDLVHHATDFLDIWETHQVLDHAYNWEYLFGLIPDLTAWPESKE